MPADGSGASPHPRAACIAVADPGDGRHPGHDPPKPRTGPCRGHWDGDLIIGRSNRPAVVDARRAIHPVRGCSIKLEIKAAEHVADRLVDERSAAVAQRHLDAPVDLGSRRRAR